MTALFRRSRGEMYGKRSRSGKFARRDSVVGQSARRGTL
jgi:hypothetical protein